MAKLTWAKVGSTLVLFGSLIDWHNVATKPGLLVVAAVGTLTAILSGTGPPAITPSVETAQDILKNAVKKEASKIKAPFR